MASKRKNNNQIKFALLLAIFLSVFSSVYALESVISYDVLNQNEDSVLVSFYTANQQIIYSSYESNGSFNYSFEENYPSTLYLLINSNFSDVNTIIVDDDEIHFYIESFGDISLSFTNSRINVLNQCFKSAKSHFNKKVSNILGHLLDKSTPLSEEVSDSLKVLYRAERKVESEKTVQLEDWFITKFSDSYLSLHLLYENIKYYRRKGAIDFVDLVNNLDSSSLHKYRLYDELKYIVSLHPYAPGDEIDATTLVTNSTGDNLQLRELVDLNGHAFVFVWSKTCPHSPRLMKRINDEIDNGLLDQNSIIAINNDPNISGQDKLDIQSDSRFKCYFYDKSQSANLIHQFWINSSPFGIIFKDGKVMQIKTRLDNFIELL